MNPFFATARCPYMLFACVAAVGLLRADDNAPGAYTISAAAASTMLLEAVGGGTTDGTVVSIGVPCGQAKQIWNIVPKGDKTYVIRPSYSRTLALTVKDGATADGTSVVLATENDQPAQLWSIQQTPDGSFGLLPQVAPGKSLDDYGGHNNPGAQINIWAYQPKDRNTQWLITPLAGAPMPFTALPAADLVSSHDISPPPPEEAPPANIPPGVTKEFTFEDSRIFPGTKRKGTVFIPAQYDGSTPACVYVQQDGFKKGDDAVLAELIAAKEMPVTVGVFIHPGMVTPAQGPPGAVRANRGLEYDSVDDKYPRFVLEELLPYVEKTFNVKLSDKAADRCIAGGSSGGIAAFNAAWWRPDAFSRVYAGSGSFSAFRYGNIFPTMVRKFEAKPIRVYLTTATNDMENAAGDWFLLDQEMDKALKFSGYDFEYFVVPGRHVSGYADHFADAMRFLWKGWPAPITPGPSSPRAQDIITGTDSWQVAADGYQDARSPVTNSKGEIFFVDPPANKIYRIAVDGSTAVFLDDAAHANGLAIGPKDELYTVSATTGNVMTYDTSGHGTVVVGELPGQYVVARPDGSLYVTNGGDVWLVKDGAKKRVDTGLKGAAGLAYRCDQWLLAVAEGASKWVCSYEIQPDGSLINKERYYPLFVQEWDDDASPGSLCYAKEGQMLVGTRAGVQSCTGDGPVQVILPLPDRSRVTGVALGGPDLHTLFACAGGKVWKRVVKLHGIGAFSPATPQPHTPL